MFYSSDLLTKRGPLARVWMASHLSTKLTKSLLLTTSIPSSVTSILGATGAPMALRLTGQLLLGVARIYSRKAKYLLDDCNETLGRVKKAFRKGGEVELTMDAGAGNDAITLRAEQGGLEDLLGFADANYWDNPFDLTSAANGNAVAGPSSTNKKAKTTAQAADITLANAYGLGGGAFDFDDFGMGAGYGAGAELDLGLDMGDGEGLDLGLFDEIVDLEGEGEVGRKRKADALDDDDDGSVELGRDAGINLSERGSVGPFGGLDGDGDLTMDKDAIGGDEFDLGLEGNDFMDVGEGAGIDFEVFGGAAGLDGRNAKDDDMFGDLGEFGDREATPVPGDQDSLAQQLTPKTAADLAKKGDQAAAAKKQRTKKIVIDKLTELNLEEDKGVIARRKELLFVEPIFLPRSRLHLRLLERSRDPSYYLPIPTAKKDVFNVAPPGFSPALSELFNVPSRRALIKASGRERTPEAEVGRRQEDVEFGAALNDDVFGDLGDFGDEGLGGKEGDDVVFQFGEGDQDFGDNGGDAFQFDVDESVVGAKDKKEKKKVNPTPSQAYIEDDVEEEFSTGPLAVFDTNAAIPGATQSQAPTQTQTGAGGVQESLGEEEENALLEAENETQVAGGKKWSKNTRKAFGVLEGEFRGNQRESVRFEELGEGATRRAAASMFFELLVLGTRDCIKLEQKDAFGGIKIMPKEKLWESFA